MTDQAMKSLAAIPRVSHIVLSGTSITDAGLDLLQKHMDPPRTEPGELAGAAHVRLLGVTDTKVTEEGARKLANPWHNVHILCGPTGSSTSVRRSP